ncbi:MAG TPA: methyltransferase domain-containing protein [Ktedonobacteraceae bacterium]|nr:methyltransferase domain-containing protein [Ktedonobacteraceae bacterium]
MSNPANPRREPPSTYTVQDRSNEEELTRLHIQDEMITTGMGGVLPEQPDPTIFKRIIDVGCGTGGWLIEVAKSYPGVSELVGIDVSSKMLNFARAQAQAQQVSERMRFASMDALRMLEFPANYFDLVNHRFAVSWLRTWDWPKLLQEYLRVARPGGVIRVTESDMVIDDSSSPAMTRLFELFLAALYAAGHYFTPDKNGVLSQLPRLLYQHGVENVQTRAYTLQYRAGTPEGQHFFEDMKRAFRTTLPFMRKWTRVPDDYETIYQQMLNEMQDPHFIAPWRLLTVWGNKPE